MDIKIPKNFRVGGQLINVDLVEDLEENLGTCCVSQCLIQIANKYHGKPQAESCRVNTFVHEVVHSILDTMGRRDLSDDEVFVNCFASFVTEIFVSINEFYEQDIPDNGGNR